MQNTRSASSAIFCRCGSIAGRVEQDCGLPGGLLRDWARHSTISPGILVEQRVVLHDQEAVVVLLQDGHELEDGEVAVQPAEDAGVVAAEEGDQNDHFLDCNANFTDFGDENLSLKSIAFDIRLVNLVVARQFEYIMHNIIHQ